ncbi:MAG: hypothetical protein NC399_01090 [Muribaculum sp.]|nr:hypothetical protein [Muribaculum sp.]
MHKIRPYLPHRCLNILYTLLFLILTACMLTHSRLSLYYAFTGLDLWYRNMVPVLLPFMILSGALIRMELTEGFTALVYPVVGPLFRVRRNVCYVIIMGFLCGFPMGAKCVGDLYARGGLTRGEASYLLAFCNNIGPIYFVSFALPLIGCTQTALCLFGMYGIPLLYGLFLRYTAYAGLYAADRPVPHRNVLTGNTLSAAFQNASGSLSPTPSLLSALDESIHASLQSILMLGGYMILFNLLMLLPHLITGNPPRLAAPLFEITGGLKLLGDSAPFCSLVLLSFGGFSCIAQTYTCIRDTDLSIGGYVFHKLILTALSAAYYSLCLRLFFRF